MKITRKSIAIIVATAAASSMLSFAAPVAGAATNTAVTSSRSFPKVNAPRKNLLAESTSTDVEKNSNWGGLGSMSVPKTKSTAEKDAAAKAKQEEQARVAAAAAAQQAEAASRSSARTSTSTSTNTSTTTTEQFTVTPPNAKTAAALVSYANQFIGQVPYIYGGSTTSGWDCSGFVMYVYAQFGISLPHSSGAQASAGTAVASLAEAQPGDIIANSAHAGIYIGNNMVVNALNPSKGTTTTAVSVAFTGSYSIRRLL
ncbi:MAG: C40 family peptidase [Bifidobacterium aquikefiri]|uniref:Peptidase P60 n=1 Tax=Bifidobacterium aquikefiri TaxID=1653207 RepID=A0A261G760_9BIFI|nr:C40 family peptidase [Bifidobacterium aquikefiri]OZG67248.1 peptidase P60 [Bifidobacterium aquikefiri]